MRVGAAMPPTEGASAHRLELLGAGPMRCVVDFRREPHRASDAPDTAVTANHCLPRTISGIAVLAPPFQGLMRLRMVSACLIHVADTKT